MNIKPIGATHLLSLSIILLLAAACVRPAPRPENVQITEMPLVVTLVATPTTILEGSAVPVTAEGGDSADLEATPDPATSWPKSHEVITGDTLSRISVIYGVPIEEIIAANQLANPDSLELGQILTIPEPGTTDISAVETTPSPTEAAGGDATSEPDQETVYIVQPGDTLFRIALTYGVTVDELADYNNIANVNDLDVGQEIRIP